MKIAKHLFTFRRFRQFIIIIFWCFKMCLMCWGNVFLKLMYSIFALMWSFFKSVTRKLSNVYEWCFLRSWSRCATQLRLILCYYNVQHTFRIKQKCGMVCFCRTESLCVLTCAHTHTHTHTHTHICTHKIPNKILDFLTFFKTLKKLSTK